MYVLLVFLGETILGCSLYLYLQRFIRKKSSAKKSNFMSIHLITNDKIKTYDNKYKIYYLIIIAAVFDFIGYIFSLQLVPVLNFCSKSLEKRIRAILILFDALFYRYVLKFQIFKHQRFSLYVISICLIITIIIEFIFQDFNIFLYRKSFALLLFYLIFYIAFNSFVDLIEKYLFEFDYVNPLQVLMFEGIIGLIMGIIYCLFYNPIPDIKRCYSINGKKFAFPFLLSFVFLIFNGAQNTFRVVTNKVYSPMALALTSQK